jgi:hypothetical protein
MSPAWTVRQRNPETVDSRHILCDVTPSTGESESRYLNLSVEGAYSPSPTAASDDERCIHKLQRLRQRVGVRALETSLYVIYNLVD